MILCDQLHSFIENLTSLKIERQSLPWQYIDLLRNLPKLDLNTIDSSEHKCIGTTQLYGEPPEIQPYVVLSGLIIFGKNCRVGPFSFLRGPLILGDNVAIGPHCEVSRCLVMNGAKIAHKNIVVDSVIGENAHLAGFTTTCNLPFGRDYINAWYEGKKHKVLGKYGATIECGAKLGASIMLMPGCNVHKNSIYPGPATIYGNNKVKQTV